MSSGTKQTSDAGNGASSNPEPFYTNEDVAVLHEIVLLAQELLPNLPEREKLPTNALFGAYYEILPQLGLNADHDNRYARILFKIGGLGAPEGLYERFEAILSRMGIEIELEEPEKEADIYDEPQRNNEYTNLERYARPQTGRRRKSESTLWDIEIQQQQTGPRRNSFSELNLPTTTLGENTNSAESISRQHNQERMSDEALNEDDLPDHNVRAWLASRPGEARQERAGSVSTHGSLRIRRRSPHFSQHHHTQTNPSVPSDEFLSPSEVTAVTSALEHTSESIQMSMGIPSDETASNLMYIKASLFRQHRMSYSTKHVFQLWRDHTLQLQEDNHNLGIIAVHEEKRFLLLTKLRAWRSRVADTQKHSETAIFFFKLEQRTQMFRDLMLIHKAFSHWREVTSEEVARTSFARRHILRTRTFNAWREYTVVNEFKIRRQRMRKFFSLWKTRHFEASANAVSAVQKREGDLARKVRLVWVEKVRSRKATNWRHAVIMQRALASWIIKCRNTEYSHVVANDQRRCWLLQHALQLWRKEYNTQVNHNNEAARHAEIRICSNALRKWRVENQVKPAKTMLQTDVNWRLLREVFALWLHRCKQERHSTEVFNRKIVQKSFTIWHQKAGLELLHSRQEYHATEADRLRILREGLVIWREKTRMQLLHARQEHEATIFDQQRILRRVCKTWREKTTFELFVSAQERKAVATDRLRILREAWTNWRHKSRLQVMSAAINERVVREAVYKWALGERILYAKRQFGIRILHNCLALWIGKCKASKELQLNLDDIAQDFTVRRAQRHALNRWITWAKIHQQRDVDAINIYGGRLLRGVVAQWSERAQHLQGLQKRSQNAEFYFVTVRMLKRWRASTHDARREKRKAAYAQVRRMIKMGLAKDILLIWRQRALKLMDSEAQALEMRRNKDVITGMNIFDRWRARTEDIAEMGSLWREKVLQKQYTAWRDRSSAFKDLEVEAIINYQERQQSRAVKRWSLLSLQQTGRSHYASEIREKNVKRTFRKTFTYWHQRTVQKRPYMRPSNQEPETLEDFARAEAWSELGEEPAVDGWGKASNIGIPPSPIPGYLSTPSKRMERIAAAAVRFSSTTPKAPLSTPFERHLRAQYSGGTLSSIRSGPKRIRLGMSAGFADIVSKKAKDDGTVDR
ncbi:Sfi1 spindle body protein-domain-containing protein [Bisporella sp. PMI_857]|nr:Sfi1 spindle body protein-domain-containing protein [Bisporella sp. PMI_857]